jgi:hypothetical protein
MKKTLLSIAAMLISLFGTAQITSIANGNANNPFIWDCICFPLPEDSVVIAHDVTMNVNWIARGGITVLAGASFVEDVAGRTILFDSACVFTNNGHVDLSSATFTNGSQCINNSTFDLDASLWVDATSTLTNTGVISSVDNTIINGTMTNAAGASFGNGDLWTLGLTTNAGTLTCDSIVNSGSFNNSGNLYSQEFGNNGDFSNSGYITVGNDYWSVGNFHNLTGGEVEVGNDFSNSFLLAPPGTTVLTNDGLFEIWNDWVNTDTINGTGGYFCVGNATTNWSLVDGTIDICDANGVGIDANAGTVTGSVTFCSSPCAVGIEEVAGTLSVDLYPNPASDQVFINAQKQIQQVDVVDVSGRLVLTATGNRRNISIDISQIPAGWYAVIVRLDSGLTIKKQLIRR